MPPVSFDSLNSYRDARTQNILQAWCVPADGDSFMDLPPLSADSETAETVDGWNMKLAAVDASLRIVAGAQTEIQLSDRSGIF